MFLYKLLHSVPYLYHLIYLLKIMYMCEQICGTSLAIDGAEKARVVGLIILWCNFNKHTMVQPVLIAQ